MSDPLPKPPAPDFGRLVRVLRGEEPPRRVHPVELFIDAEVMEEITTRLLGREWVPYDRPGNRERYLENVVEIYARLGYDFVPTWPEWRNLPTFRAREAPDTAELSRGKRTWVEESGGIIRNRADFERIDWDRIEYDLSGTEWLARHLPDGMSLVISNTLFEMVLERFLGYEDLFLLSVEDPELVSDVLDAWGRRLLASYRDALSIDRVDAVFHADDLGFRTGTLLSPDFLRRNVFPWFRRFASLAHAAGKPYWYHCCGNVMEIMDDLIDDVGIDAFHSFQDPILPVADFLRRYGDRVAALGGVDMDAISRLDEESLRRYVRKILDDCMPGRFALGTGNTVANYVPLRNYLAMLDEARAWRP